MFYIHEIIPHQVLYIWWWLQLYLSSAKARSVCELRPPARHLFSVLVRLSSKIRQTLGFSSWIHHSIPCWANPTPCRVDWPAFARDRIAVHISFLVIRIRSFRAARLCWVHWTRVDKFCSYHRLYPRNWHALLINYLNSSHIFLSSWLSQLNAWDGLRRRADVASPSLRPNTSFIRTVLVFKIEILIQACQNCVMKPPKTVPI